MKPFSLTQKQGQPFSLKSKAATDAHISNRPPKERDPNRLDWGGIRISDEKQFPFTRNVDVNGKMSRATDVIRARALPDHPDKNPFGFVQVIKFKVADKSGGMHYVVSPATLGQPCPFVDFVKTVDDKYTNDAEFREWYATSAKAIKLLEDPDALASLDPETVRGARFVKEYMQFCDTWSTYFVPVVMWAEHEEKVRFGTPYKDPANLRSNPKNTITKILEFGDWASTKALLRQFNAPTDENGVYVDEDGNPIDETEIPIKINDANEGLPFTFCRTKSGTTGEGRVGYHIEVPPGRPGPLPKEIKDKLDVRDENGNDVNYPDVVEWKVRKHLLAPPDMVLRLLNSVLGEVAVEKGLLLRNSMQAPVVEENDMF